MWRGITMGRERTARSDGIDLRVPNMVAVRFWLALPQSGFMNLTRLDGRGGNGN